MVLDFVRRLWCLPPMLTSMLVLSAALGVLPYIEIPSLGPIHPFGLLVVVGIFVGQHFADKRAVRIGMDLKKFQSLTTWTVFLGIVISHAFDQIFYYPESVLEKPWELLFFWKGLSSFGGLFGAAIAFNWYGRKHKMDLWRSADCIAYGLPTGFFFGRMGCAVVHDHPGMASDHWLAVAFPGGPRFDLGLIEMMLLPLLIGLMFFLDKRVTRPGGMVAILAMTYPFLRFPLDFLRAGAAEGGDVRYFGLTPGHYSAIFLLGLGIFLWLRAGRAATREAPRAAAA